MSPPLVFGSHFPALYANKHVHHFRLQRPNAVQREQNSGETQVPDISPLGAAEIITKMRIAGPL